MLTVQINSITNVRSSILWTHDNLAWNGARVYGDYNASNLRISWHCLHKICEVITARGAPQSRTPLHLAFAL